MRVNRGADRGCPDVYPMKQSRIILVLSLMSLTTALLRADDTWVYSVQLSAIAQTAPPKITLNWPVDIYGANNYTVYRKTKEGTNWGTGTVLSGSVTAYVDTNVTVGGAYEYQVIKAATLGYTGYGYCYAGVNAPLVEDRGKLLLIVATNAAASLSNELARLESDLTGDGWLVIRHNVSSNNTPASVRSLIAADYAADPVNVRAVFLFGHVPVLQSGNLNYDGHLARPMPADAYYGDVDGDWSGSPDFLPSDVELMVGRVDLFSMPGNGAAVAWPNETELLRNYLNKDHNWRHKLIAVPHLALMGNRRGDEGGEATAASGYRNFQPLVGPGNTIEANVEDNAPLDQRWNAELAAGTYLWAYGCGGGQPTAISYLGPHGSQNEIWSTDVVGGDAKAVFVMLFGSWFGNWDGTDNMMRSFLATPTMGLAACMAGRPHWFVHHMGLGETIGYGTRLSMNNNTLYQNNINDMMRAIYIALMGDPTLRLDPVAPPSAFSGTRNGAKITLNWSASSDATAGYHVYRATSASGPFVRLTTALLAGTTFTDTNAPASTSTYEVRAVKLQTTPSGTYFNPSQGIFISINGPIQLQAHPITGGLLLSWNAQPGTAYRVQAKTNLLDANWSDASGVLTATGTNASWTDTNNAAQRFYRIASP
jgi:hypothetical protein